VEFYVNNILQATDTASPYSFSWNTTAVTNGSYALSAKAYDTEGNVGQSASVSVTANNIVPDNTPPTVVINSPSAGAKVDAPAKKAQVV
jgi:chitinase